MSEELFVVPTRSFCNHCQNGTNHEVVAQCDRERHDGAPELPRVIQENWLLMRCRGCESLKLCIIKTSPDFKEPQRTEFPPKQRRIHQNWFSRLPPELQSLIWEIYTALNAECPSLSAMGARSLIDLMLTDMLGDIGGFAAKLNQAEADGLLTVVQKGIITAAVETGHAASHRGFTPTMDQVNDVLDIVEHALKDNYVLAEASRRLEGTVPRRNEKAE